MRLALFLPDILVIQLGKKYHGSAIKTTYEFSMAQQRLVFSMYAVVSIKVDCHLNCLSVQQKGMHTLLLTF